MKKYKLNTILVASLAFISSLCSAQSLQQKTLEISRAGSTIKIDGKLDEQDWLNAQEAGYFVEFEPDNGKPELPEIKNLAKVTYDDVAIYVGAELSDVKMDSVFTQLSQRDSFDTSDWFTFSINPYNDGQQEFQFTVTAANVQSDVFFTNENGSDSSWDVIWESKVVVHEGGWTVEMKIPFTSLRFPKEKMADWGINFYRKIIRKGTTYSWNFINNNKGSQALYMGNLRGLNDIQPPTRLFLIPYSSFYVTSTDGINNNQFKAGMDVKWGITDEFTLDAILIPDFGQTSFDNTEYILGPFEQEFSERRPFFTEGVNLFQKNGLFYSRRIGEVPGPKILNLQENEEIVNYPGAINLVNAAKISGRTKSGWGIGLLNAITEETHVSIKDTNMGTTRSAIISPLTNYNVAVVDKRFGQNSSFTFTNTNVLREGDFTDANVSAASIDYIDRENKYNYKTTVRYSHLQGMENPQDGIATEAGWGKVFGKNRYGIDGAYVSKHFEMNDLGINFYRNYYQIAPWHSYRILQSNKTYNALLINNSFFARWNRLNNKPENIYFKFQYNSTSRFLNYNEYGFELKPFTMYDFYEPRTEGRYSEVPKQYGFWYYRKPNYNKVFLTEISPYLYFTEHKNRWGYFLNVAPRYRLNDRFVFIGRIIWREDFADRGFVENMGGQIIFGGRDLRTITTTFEGNYFINPKTSVALNFRHYWTSASYKNYFDLNEDGSYTEANYPGFNHDFTYNNWNIDLNVTWWFAPASQLSFLYRNTISGVNDRVIKNLSEDLDSVFSLPTTHIFSLRVSYLLDYHTARHWFN